MQSDDNRDRGGDRRLNVRELAEFIQSFYDRESNTFPKGPEGVVVMVGKKFGEQAEQVARKFVERMAPHQEQGAEQMQELARIRELAGMPSNNMDEGSEERVKFRGTDHDIGEERYVFAVDGNPLVFNFPSDEDNPDPDSPSFEEILAKVQRDGAVEHFGVTPEEQQAMAEKIADERQKYLDQRREGVEEGSDRTSDKVADALAQKGVKYTREKEQEIIDMIGEVLADMGMDDKKIQYLMSYDQDFISDTLDALPREDNVRDDFTPELEDIRRLSGIAQGLGL